jgi:hypothetical protein
MFSMSANKSTAKLEPAEVLDSGREQVRLLLRSWASTPGGLAHLARTLSPPVGIQAMSDFASGGPPLSGQAIDIVARALLRARYHADIDRLEQLNKPSVTVLPAYGSRHGEMTAAQKLRHEIAERGGRAVEPAPVSPEKRAELEAQARKPRPGWI